MTLLLYLIFTAFILIEIFVIDPFFWKRGKSDKPWSTILYVFIILCFWLTIGEWFVLVVGLSARAFFDTILNMSGKLPSGKRDICYHNPKIPLIKPNPTFNDKIGLYSDILNYHYEKLWKLFPCWLELTIRIVWFSLGAIYYVIFV